MKLLNCKFSFAPSSDLEYEEGAKQEDTSDCF